MILRGSLIVLACVVASCSPAARLHDALQEDLSPLEVRDLCQKMTPGIVAEARSPKFLTSPDWTKLQESGCDLTRRDDFVRSPLLLAAAHGNMTALTGMLRGKINPNALFSDSVEAPTPIFHAVMFRNLAGVRALVSYGADLSMRNSSGQTPLLFAKAGQYEVIEALIEAGSDLDAVERNGKGVCETVWLSQNQSDSPARKRVVFKLRKLGHHCG